MASGGIWWHPRPAATCKKLAKNMATISLKLDRRRANARGLFPVQFLLSHKGATTTIGTGISIRPEHWNGEVNRAVVPKCPNARAINADLEGLYFRLSNTLRGLETDGRLAGKGVVEIKRLLTVPQAEGSPELFTDYFQRYADSRRTENSRAACLYTLKAVRAFGGDDLTFEEITVVWLRALEAHLTEQGLSVNSRAIHFRNIRAVFNSAIDEDLVGLDAYPFRKIKIAIARKEK